jgi:putative hydrolase of the HAD superfamily
MIEALFFDVGGVLVPFRGLEEIDKLAAVTYSKEAKIMKWESSPYVQSYEIGAIGDIEFAQGFVDEWDLSCSPSQFLREFANWVTAPSEATITILRALSTRFELCTISNTNRLHWERIDADSRLSAVVPSNFPSFVTRLRKPSSRAFLNAAERLGLDVGSVLFFDDSIDNIRAAQELGMSSYVVDSPDSLVGALEVAGVI